VKMEQRQNIEKVIVYNKARGRHLTSMCIVHSLVTHNPGEVAMEIKRCITVQQQRRKISLGSGVARWKLS